MKPKFDPSVAQIQKVSYVKEAKETFLLDCGDGCSPYGCSKKVAQALRQANIQDVAVYPHGFELKDAIIRRWKKYVELSRATLYLHNSGMDAIMWRALEARWPVMHGKLSRAKLAFP